MRTLKEILADASKRKVAIGHFNISETAALKAIAEVARDLKVPVMVGTSEGEREFLDQHEAVAMVRELQEKHGQEIFINADHTKSVEKAKEAVDAGYDEVLFDGAKLTMEENVKQTSEVVKYARAKNPDILVEGEIGDIGSGSTIRKEIPKGLALSSSNGAAINPEQLTKPEDAAAFVKATGIDLLAPAVGNIHGMFANAPEPALDLPRIAAIHKAAGIPLVLHGGSGNTDADFLGAIDGGVAIIHISTELRLAWRKGMEATLKKDADEVAPYKLLAGSIDEMKKVLEHKLRLFNKLL